MGTALSCQLGFLSLFHRKSKPRVKHGRRTPGEVSRLNNSDHMSLNNNNISSTDLHFVRELVPERYLVLLTEQMTEMLFGLMTFNETFTIISESGSDHQATSRFSVGSNNTFTPIIISSSNLTSDRSSSQLQSLHQSCDKCKMKMLTIEEFRELHNAFYRVDSDHDNFLTQDEIRTTLNYLFELTESDLKEIISVFDTNKDDRISLEEYIEEMKHRLLHEFTREEIKLAFDQADVQQNGHLRADELKNAIDYLNLHLPNRRLVEIVNDCVKNEPTDSIDFVFFTKIVEALHRREPITLQKFKPIHHITYTTTTS